MKSSYFLKTLLRNLSFLVLFSGCGEFTGEDTGAYRSDAPKAPETRPDPKKSNKISDSSATKQAQNESSDSESLNLVGGLEFRELGEQKFLLAGTTSNTGNSSHLFTVEALIEDDAPLKLHFFSNQSLKNGLIALVSRKSDIKVEVELLLNGMSDKFEVDNLINSALEVAFDIHNDHTDMHILVWNKSGPFGDNDECSFDGNCLYNSEDFALDRWLGVGKAGGQYWGIEAKPNQIIKLEGPLDAKSDA